MKLPIAALLFSASACGAGGGAAGDATAPATQAVTGDWPAAAFARMQVQVRARPDMVQAFWPASIYEQFWVTVRDDGSPRDTLAREVCAEFAAAGMPRGQTVTIRIYDADEMEAGRLRQLATLDCTAP